MTNYTQEQVKNAIVSDLWTAAQPWLIPSILIVFISYAVIRLVEKFLAKDKKIPREIKAMLPVVIGIVIQFIEHRFSDLRSFLILFGIGFAHGAIISTFYEMAISRLKKKIHGEK